MRHHSWRKLLLAIVLEFAALSGAPLRPKDIEAALRSANATVAEQRARDEDGTPPPLL